MDAQSAEEEGQQRGGDLRLGGVVHRVAGLAVGHHRVRLVPGLCISLLRVLLRVAGLLVAGVTLCGGVSVGLLLLVRVPGLVRLLIAVGEGVGHGELLDNSKVQVPDRPVHES